MPFPEVDFVITDPEGATLPTGTVGEIVIRSLHLPAGYIGMTSPAFTTGQDGRAHFLTGDIGRVDGSGVLTVLGRCDSMVKIRGTQVLLRDVQAAIEHHPAVTEAMVTGYLRADGEPRLCAHLVADYPIGLSDLVRYLKTRGVEPPSQLFHYGVLPRTRTGKVDHRALAQPQDTMGAAPRDETAMIAALRAIWSEIIRPDDFNADARLEDIGGDSHDAMRILLLVEERFGRDIRMDEALFDGFSLASLARLLSTPEIGGPISILSRAGSGRTIFALPVEGGHVSHMVPLLTEIAGQRTVAVVRSEAELGGQSAVARLTDMGRNAAQSIMAHGSAEGAILIGFSAGATLAFETTRHLQKAGVAIAGLILLDPPSQWRRILPEARAVLGPLIRRGDLVWARRGAASLLGRAGFESPSEARRFAWASYRAAPLKTPVPSVMVAAGLAGSADAKSAWRSVVGAQLEVIDVPGDHTRFLRPPLERHFVEKLKAWIDQR